MCSGKRFVLGLIFFPVQAVCLECNLLGIGEYSLQFDGATDYVLLEHTAAMLGPGWEENKTVSLWVKPAGISQSCDGGAAHCDAIFGDRPRWWGISRGVIGGSDKIWLWNYDGSLDAIGVDYVVGEWVHLAMVHSGGFLRAFKDGVESAAIPSGATLQPTTGALPVLQLGGVINATLRNWTFEGEIDEVAIWNTERSPAQLARDVYDVLGGNEEGLVAYYRMSNGSGDTLADDSVNDWTGSLKDGGPGVNPDGNTAAWVVSETPLIDPAALQVDSFFPQFADGSAGTLSFRSSLTLANTGSTTSWVRVEFFGSPDGAPMLVSLSNLGTQAAFEFALRRGEIVTLETPGTATPQLGYARIRAGSDVGAVLVFHRLDTATGLSMYEAGVPACQVQTKFSVAVDSLGTRDSGLAIVYPAEGGGVPAEIPETLVEFRLYDEHHIMLGETTLVLPAGHHLARYVHQIFENDPGVAALAQEMRGILVVESEQPLAAVTVRQKDDPFLEFPLDVPILTTYPVIPGAPPR